MVFIIEGGRVTAGVVRVGHGLVKHEGVQVPGWAPTDGRESGFCDFPKGKGGIPTFRPLTFNAAVLMATEMTIGA